MEISETNFAMLLALEIIFITCGQNFWQLSNVVCKMSKQTQLEDIGQEKLPFRIKCHGKF